MIIQMEDETRIEYLIRVLTVYMEDCGGEYTIDYDGVTCDGMCLAQDIANELNIDQSEW